MGRAQRAQRAQVVGILGTCGGVGASTLTVGLGRAAAMAGLSAVCVDTQWFSGGLDVITGVEHLPGLRWADLRRVRGRMDGAELLAELPTGSGVPVLSVDRCRPGATGEEAVDGVLGALTEHTDICLIDLPRWGMPLAERLRSRVDDLILVGGASVGALASVAAITALLGAGEHAPEAAAPDEEPGGRWWLVHRDHTRDPALAETVAAALELPLLAVVPDDSCVTNSLTRGEAPGETGGVFCRACERILVALRQQVVVS